MPISLKPLPHPAMSNAHSFIHSSQILLVVLADNLPWVWVWSSVAWLLLHVACSVWMDVDWSRCASHWPLFLLSVKQAGIKHSSHARFILAPSGLVTPQTDIYSQAELICFKIGCGQAWQMHRCGENTNTHILNMFSVDMEQIDKRNCLDHVVRESEQIKPIKGIVW